jgi:hypothetical protein
VTRVVGQTDFFLGRKDNDTIEQEPLIRFSVLELVVRYEVVWENDEGYGRRNTSLL